MPNADCPTPKGSAPATATVACVVAFGIGQSAFGIGAVTGSVSVRNDTLYRILVAEDARAPASSDLQIILDVTRHEDPVLRRVAVRALGRLERPSLIDRITPLLAAPEPAVRSAAANALGQALFGASPESTPNERSRVAAALAARLEVETDPGTRGTIGRTLGRLDYETEQETRRAESILAGQVSGSLLERDGAVRGLERLFRQRPNRPLPGPETVERLRRAVRETFPAVGAAFESERFAAIRRLALQTLGASGSLDDATAAAAVRDPDWQVRRLALSFAPPRGREVAAALDDPSASVRLEAVRRIGGAEKTACAELIKAAGDPDPHVARGALRWLGRPCDDGTQHQVGLLASLARRSSPSGGSPGRHWGIRSEALAALASVCTRAEEQTRRSPGCAGARELVRDHATDSRWQIRMYAAGPASGLGQLATVRRLARDSHPNVREAAIQRLAAHGSAEDTPLIIDALASNDYQLVRTAALALKGSRHPRAAAALMRAFERISAKRSDTARDPLAALADTLRDMGVLVHPLPPARRTPPPFTRGELDELLAKDRSAIVTMRSGGVFELSLMSDGAPASVARFSRLARRGVYDGLTFHRVEPNFVIQGGSPGANEYAGHDPSMRDEVGLASHARGAVGISTRGRDTGDAQMFINLVDNPRLDHRYTVFARVTRGMQVVDAIVEGDAIARIVIR